jgi:hypothetical protein
MRSIWMPRRSHQTASLLGRRGHALTPLFGHADVSTTMVYTHVLNRGPLGVRSPADRLSNPTVHLSGGSICLLIRGIWPERTGVRADGSSTQVN